ncbi:MAG: hypothetical protein ABJ013_05145 [Halioglobus sp.]
MTTLKLLLLVSTVVIYVFTYSAVTAEGFNWPAVAFGDILALNWRSQFDADLVIHLLLLATWVSWREGFSMKGHFFGFLSIVMGGMFSFPYLLHAIYVAKGDPIGVLLGDHQSDPA